MARFYHVDPTTWTEGKRRAWQANMLRMQAADMLSSLSPEQMAGMPLDTLYQLKLAACQDREEARRWKMRIYAARLEARMSAES